MEYVSKSGDDLIYDKGSAECSDMPEEKKRFNLKKFLDE